MKPSIAIGITQMSIEEMKNNNQGVGVIMIHHLNDGLWKTLF